MKDNRKNYIFPVLIVSVLIFFFIDVALGSVAIPLKNILGILLGREESHSWSYIVLNVRLPRAVGAVITGAGLAVSGLMMQSLFRNPLAGPYILGISSGASLGVALFIMTGTLFAIVPAESLNIFNSLGELISAVLGSMLVFFLIIFIATKVRDTVSLLIVGIMIGSLATSVVSILQYFSRPELVFKFALWTMGSLSAITWQQVYFLLPVMFCGFALSVYLIKPLNAFLLGEIHARATGVSVESMRYLILTSGSIITGALTAYVGPIAFVGLVVPHLTRLLLKTTDHKVLMPACFFSGAALLLMCDIISQVPGSSMVLPINSVTALFGIPIVLWIILGRKQLKTSF